MAAVSAPSSSPRAASAASDSCSDAASEWYFLEEWFTMLGEEDMMCNLNDLNNKHDVRVGDDSTDDMWLSVSLDLRRYENPWSTGEQSPDEDESKIAREDLEWPMRRKIQKDLGLLRDAVLITSIVSKTDYEGWFAMTKEYADRDEQQCPLFQVRVNGVLPQIPIQFRFRLENQHHLKFLEFSGCLGHVFGTLGHSDDYNRDLQRVRDILSARGIPWENVPPTKIKLDLVQTTITATPEDVSRRLFRTVEAI